MGTRLDKLFVVLSGVLALHDLARSPVSYGDLWVCVWKICVHARARTPLLMAAGITTGSVSGSVFSLTGSLKPLDLPGSLQVIAPDEEKQAYNWDDHDEQVWHVDSVQQQNSQGQNGKLERAGDNNNNNSQQQQQQTTLLHQGHKLVYVHIHYSKELGKHQNVLPMPAWRPLIDNRLIASTNRYFYKCTSTESSLFPRQMFGRRPFCTTHFFEMGWAVGSGYRHEPCVAGQWAVATDTSLVLLGSGQWLQTRALCCWAVASGYRHEPCVGGQWPVATDTSLVLLGSGQWLQTRALCCWAVASGYRHEPCVAGQWPVATDTSLVLLWLGVHCELGALTDNQSYPGEFCGRVWQHVIQLKNVLGKAIQYVTWKKKPHHWTLLKATRC